MTRQPGRRHRFALLDVLACARRRFQDLDRGDPSGRLDEGQKETAIRTIGKIAKPSEFDDVVVATRGTYQVKVKDLGYTEDGGAEIRSEARLNGQPAVTLTSEGGGRKLTVGVRPEDMDIVARECRYVTGRTVPNGGAGDSSILTALGVFEGMRAYDGESLKDTALTLQAMGADAVVIRHSSSGSPSMSRRATGRN